MASLKLTAHKQTDRQTGQKQYAPNPSMQGHKNNFKLLVANHNLVSSTVNSEEIQICDTVTYVPTTYDYHWMVQKNIKFQHKAPVRHTLQPLCDLSATDNFHQSQRSQQGPPSVPARLQRSRPLVGDLAATKSVADRFLNMFKKLAATDLVADRSWQSRQPVSDQSPAYHRLMLLESGRGYHWS